ncbi:hypothetical protein GO755_36965 [Spirosoma sp. HMF4905]|uniref:TraB/GumN family protein n=1 Tax=Spirosoma arboris TaxID=2682092 RepID=A0A7K1SPZ8_9BACT|nr:DUF5694 domain-containing protein [Spirosoma arboris]MVM35666.1 hypothetical protein [Spirosoma arboris]
MRLALVLSLILLSYPIQAQPKIQVVLLGMYHLNNPGQDVAKVKVDDVLGEKRQAEIRWVVDALKAYGPEQIFTEYSPEQQPRLDSLYRAYRAGGRRDKRGELDQIVFRLANQLGLKPGQIVGVDDTGDFPYDSLMKVANRAGQQALLSEMNRTITDYTSWFNTYLRDHTIGEVLLALNTAEQYRWDLGGYSNLVSQVGGPENSVGAYLTAEWYKRNIYTHSHILKRIAPGTKRILVVFGASHAAVLNHLFGLSNQFEVVPLPRLLK